MRSLDARLLVRVYSTGAHLHLKRRHCIGSVALRLATIRGLCAREAGADDPAEAAGGTVARCPPRWFPLRLRAKRAEALRAEEDVMRQCAGELAQAEHSEKRVADEYREMSQVT